MNRNSVKFVVNIILFLFSVKILLILLLTLFQTPEENLDGIERIICSSGNESCVYFFADKIVVYSNSSVKNEISLSIEESDLIAQYHPIFVNSNLFFIQHFGGRVYMLEDQKLNRIDNSYTHRSQLLSSLFTYNNEIYRFGGYGFFDARNFLTKYNFNSNEWDVLAVNKGELPPGLFDTKAYLLNNELYILGGKKINPFDRNIFENSKAVWKFNLDNNIWTYLGEFEFFENLLYKKNDFVFDNKFFFLEHQRLYSFDPINSVIEEIQSLPIQGKIDGRFPIIIIGDEVNYFTRTSNEKSMLLKKTEPVSSLRYVVEEIESLDRQPKSQKYLFLLLLLILCVGWVLVSRHKKAERNIESKSWDEDDWIYLMENELVYNNSRVKISDKEKALINLLLSKNVIETNEVLEIFHEEEVTYSQKLRMKNELIFQLNTKFKVLSNTNLTMVDKIQSSKDKRILTYTLNIRNIRLG